jgi:starch synthase
MIGKPLRILHVASEVAPFSKSGGLADVCSSLPTALAELGHDVVVISPRYGTLRDFSPKSLASRTSITLNDHKFDIEFLEQDASDSKVRFLFVDCAELYDRKGYYYDSATNMDYTDNDARFAVLTCAALTWCRENDWIPQIVHGHDWQAGGTPLFMRSPRFGGFFDDSRFVFTIHNMAFQGRFHSGSRVWFDHAEGLSEPGGPAEFHGMFNLLKLAVELADAINTVSPTYAHELRTIDHMSFGLGPLLHKRHGHFFGILNGLDTNVWNPETDENLAVKFNATTLAMRNRNKRALCERAGLEYDKSMPLVGMVTRISEQKGFGALLPVAGELISEPAQLVVLGNGDPEFEKQLLLLQQTYPQRVKLITEYNEPLAHLIYGGADIFLMPSLFEPCGLSQMMALRYGAPPVARDTGGLSDTISDVSHNPNGGTGISVQRVYTASAFSSDESRVCDV